MKNNRIIMILVLMGVLFLSACGQGNAIPSSDGTSSWQEQYDLGMRYLSEGNYEEAIIAFTAAIEIDPKQAPAYIGRGDTYSGAAASTEDIDEKLDWFQKAVEDYQAALELGDESAEEKLQMIGALLEQIQNGDSELLQPLYMFFSHGDLDSAKALMRTEEYQNLSASLADGHYEYTENGAEYIAVYSDNYYYFGTMEAGQRSGHGLWICAVYGEDSPYESRIYDGNWAGNFPNGEGVITNTRDIGKIKMESGMIYTIRSEIRGSFKDGLYHGTFYEAWDMHDGDHMEWSPITAVDGIYQPYPGELGDGYQDGNNYTIAVIRDENLPGAGIKATYSDDGEVHSVPGFGD